MYVAIGSMKSNKDEILVAHNLGLGDHFICNGLVNYLSQYYKIFLPVYHTSHHSNLTTIESLYANNPNVELLKLTDHDAAISIWRDPDSLPRYFENLCLPTIDVEMFRHKPANIAWYRYFYEQFDVPYAYRYKYADLPMLLEAVQLYDAIIPPNVKYRIIHNTSSSNQYELDMSSSDELINIYVASNFWLL